MLEYILILKHRGKRKNFYSVHLMSDRNEYLRIYGKFSSLIKAKKRAKELSEKFGNIEIKFDMV